MVMISLTLASCEDQLNVEKLANKGSEENFYKTDDDAEAAIAAAYVDLDTVFGYIKEADDLMSDDFHPGGSRKGDSADMQDIGNYVTGSTSAYIQSMFTSLYRLIYHSNLVIERFDNPDTEIKRRNVSEAYFFRGFAHFYLGVFFGSAPIVDHLLGTDEYSQPNSSKDALFGQAVSDLSKAIAGNLTSKATAEDRTVRVTVEAAKSYLGKVYVFQENWAEAARMLDEVVESGKYELYGGDYLDLLHAKNDYCPEYVFEWNSVGDSQNVRLHTYYILRGLRGEFYNMQNCTDDDLYAGWGFFNPTQSLADDFISLEGPDGWRFRQVLKDYSQLGEMNITLLEGSTLYDHAGWWNWKQRFLESDYIVFLLFPQVNHCFMRYAEVLLLDAEAQLRSGNTSKALDYVNRIRSRAHMSPRTSLSMEELKLEKRAELFGEGCRWSDLVRWGDAPVKLADKGKVITSYTTGGLSVTANVPEAGFKVGKNEVLPIPDVEITLNPNMTQNPQW